MMISFSSFAAMLLVMELESFFLIGNLQLRSGEIKVIGAAYDAGFTNVDTFTRTFYREFGLKSVLRRNIIIAKQN